MVERPEAGLKLTPNGSRAPGDDAPSGRLDVGRLESFCRLALDSALAQLIPALAARGVRPLLLKGPVFASWLYGDPRERPYGDIDLLVAPARYAAARRGLADLGFENSAKGMRSGEAVDHHEEWIRPGGGCRS